ncbi:MAG: sugar-binding transcriptional regulator [Kiloniellaceae bacterium]
MAQIGARLGLSRHKVGRLLKEAVETGIVRIEITTPFARESELARRLEAGLGLKTSLVVEIEDDLPEDEVKKRTCAAGAEFLDALITRNETIGVGWGSTTFELVNQLAAHNVPGVTVVQITGGNKWLTLQFDCQEVTRRLAGKLGVDPVLLHAPGIVDNKETRDLLLKESSILDTFRHFDSIDIAIVGIGSLVPVESSTLLASGYIPRADLDTLKAAGAVGDVFSYFIDAEGNLVRTELYDRLITIGIEQLRRVPTSIGVATGAAKARAVLAAARGGFVNTLIVDAALASAVIEVAEAGARSRPPERTEPGSPALPSSDRTVPEAGQPKAERSDSQIGPRQERKEA